MADRSVALDHIVILLPYAQLTTLPGWITRNFTVTPGGRHGDNRTENKLVIFADGSYLELIAFINDDPKLRKGHWWDKPFGIVDFAFTTSDGAKVNFSEMQERLEKSGSDVRYEEPQHGSRKREDGQVIEWHVTFPVTGDAQRGELPFFCHDVTDRSLRVPMDKKNTTHPGFGYGIKGLIVYVAEEKVDALAKAYGAILNTPNMAEGEHLGIFQTKRLHPVDGAEEYVDFTIQSPEEDWQIKEVNERGFYLGDMVVGGISMLATPGFIFRIDVEGEGGEEEEQEDDEKFSGIGRVFRELDLPPGWSIPEGEEKPVRTLGAGGIRGIPAEVLKGRVPIDPRTARLSSVQQRPHKGPDGKEVM